jgi:hypothetical protein
VQPLLIFLGFSAFIVYASWAGMQGINYWVPGTRYLSPMYAPVLFDSWKIAPASSGHAWFGPWPSWLPHYVLFQWAVLTPAALILWAPGGFRLTCYYYRGAYYKAFWADPPSCAVGEPRKRYFGENSFPLIFQNIHRYFLYLALLFLIVLAYDVWMAMWFDDGAGGTRFGIGLGTIVLAVNLVLLSGYTLGCHSFRHLVGGVLDQFSKHPTRLVLYDCATSLNCRHMKFAWASLFSVALADLYVRLCSMGVLTDWRII